MLSVRAKLCLLAFFEAGFLLTPACANAQVPGTINPLSYPGTDLCLKIQAAISANASSFPQGIIIDARGATGTQACSVNPLAGAAVPGQLLLGETILQITAPLVTPSIKAWQISGVGRGNASNSTATLIQAVTGFPANGRLVRLGDGTNLTFGTRIENLAIDCNNISGTIGVYSSDIQEQSGGEHLLITNCPAHGLWINGSGNDGVAPFADNYAFRDVEVYGNNSSPSTVGCEFDGDFTNQGNGPHEIQTLTCSSAVTDFLFDGITGSHISNLNAEKGTTGYLVASNAPLNGVTFDGLNSSAITGDVVHIQNVVSSHGNFNQGLSFTSVINGGAVSPVTLQDDVSGVTLHDFILGQYALGARLPRVGWTRLTSSPSSTSILPQLIVDNGADTANVIKVGSGNTVTQASVLEFDDRGSAAWNIGKDASGDFQIFDFASGVLRFFAPTGSFPYTGIASLGSAPILFNMFPGSGTGGVQFGSGGSSPTAVANISTTGAATFTSVYIPTLGASSHPLCTTTGGLITNVGCSSSALSAARPEAATTANAVSSIFGRRGAVTASAGDYDVSQITGAAPVESPLFAGAVTLPSVAGIGAATFAPGQNDVVGNSATANCVPGHVCDSLSGTASLQTGTGDIRKSGTTALRIDMPVDRKNLPNCVVTGSNAAVKHALAILWEYTTSSSLTISFSEPLQKESTYLITYVCVGS